MEISQHLQGVQPSYIREILSAAKSDNVISLAGGLPASDQLPVDMMLKAMETLKQTPDVFQYGETAGYKPLLDYLRNSYNLGEGIGAMICNGSQQGLDLIARAFINPGDVVAMEAPSYLGAIQVFGLAQAHIKSVQQNANGPDLDALEALFAEGETKLFYAVPDFHNPTGVCWSLDTRKSVAELCIRHGVTLVEDAPYREIRFTGEPLPLVSSFCPEQSMLLRSFSKVSAPGIRLGIVTAPTAWLEPMIKVKQASDLHTGLPMQAVLLETLKMPEFQQHLKQVSLCYKERYDALSSALTRLEVDGCHFNDVEGGMFVWLQLPQGDPMKIATAALENGIAVVPGSVFYYGSPTVQPALRLNFSHCTPDEFEIAITKLQQTLKAHNGTKSV